MGIYFYVDVRQQFIIPTTPIATFPASDWSAMENDGTNYASDSGVDGDSYYTTLWVLPSCWTVNFRFMVDTNYLPSPTDYFVCTIDLDVIPNEIVCQVTKYVASVPYPSWRLRINRLHFPYQTLKVADLSNEGDITQVNFNQTLDWIATPFGISPQEEKYFFLKMTGWPQLRVHSPFPILGNPNLGSIAGEELRL